MDFLRGKGGKAQCFCALLAFAVYFAVPTHNARANVITECTSCDEDFYELDDIVEGEMEGLIADIDADFSYWLYPLNVNMNAVAVSMTAATGAQTDYQTNQAQAVVDSNTLPTGAPGMNAVGTAAAMNRGINRVSSGCLTTKMRQAAAGIRYGSRSAARAMAAVMGTANRGPNADSKSPGAAAEAVNDRCKIGFIDGCDANGAYGNLGVAMKCACNADYVDADTRLSSVLDPIEYPAPQQNEIQQLPDKSISFVGAGGTVVSSTLPTGPNGQPLTGVGADIDFAAAWKFCENLRPDTPTPPHDSGTVTPVAIAGMYKDAKTLSHSTGALETCLKAIAYRTRCPSNPPSPLALVLANNGNGQDCAKAQAAICSRLTSKPPIGYGLTFQSQDANSNSVPNGSELANILIGCQQNLGISPAAYDYVMANKCGDDTFVQNMKTRLGSDAAVEHALAFECKQEENYWHEQLQREETNLEKAIKNLEKEGAIAAAGSGQLPAAARGAK